MVVFFLCLSLSFSLYSFTANRYSLIHRAIATQLTKTNAWERERERELPLFSSPFLCSHSILDLSFSLFIILLGICSTGVFAFVTWKLQSWEILGDLASLPENSSGVFGFSLIRLFSVETGAKYCFF